jgi:hypothetical protein
MATIDNLVHETSTSTGTGSLTIANVFGKQSFNTAFSTGSTDVFYYFISNRSAAEWEVGTGHLSAASTLVRDTVIEGSNGGSLVDFGAGTKDVTCDIVATRQINNLGSNLAFSLADAGADAIFGWDDSVSQYENLTGAEAFAVVKTAADAVYQPIDSDLTSWAAITRASGFDTFVATPSSANLDTLVTGNTGSGALCFATSPGFTTAANPVSNDGAALGTTALGWSDLFLADGGVVNWGNGGVTVTHTAASDSLAFVLDSGAALGSTLFTVAVDGVTSMTLGQATGPTGSSLSHIFDLGTADYPSLVVKNATNGAAQIHMYVDDTTPNNNDLGVLAAYAKDSAGNVQFYGQINFDVGSTTSGAEEGIAEIKVVTGGASATRLRVDGDGLKFNGDTAAANALNDYETGTWSPQLATSGTAFTSVTYNAGRGGVYLKMGGLVFISAIMWTDAITVGSASGNLRITNLPFTSMLQGGSVFGATGAISVARSTGFTGEEPLAAEIQEGTVHLNLYYRTAVDGATTNSSFADANTGASTNIMTIAGCYRV